MALPGWRRLKRGVDVARNALVEIVGAADHGQDRTGLAVENHGGRVVHTAVTAGGVLAGRLVTAGEGGQAPAHGGLGLALQVDVKRRRHAQAAVAQPLRAELLREQRLDVHDKMGRLDVEQARAIGQRLGRYLGRGGGVEIARLLHQPQHGQLAVLGRLRVGERVVAGGILDKARQQRAFGGAQLRRRLGEKDLRRRLQAKGKVAVVGLVQVERQQFVLCVAALQLPGQPRLAQLAPQRLLIAFVGREQQRARQLLGQRGAAADDRAAVEVLPDRAGDGHRIHAEMGKEALVFGGNRGVDAGIGDVGEREVDLLARLRVHHLVEELAVTVDDLRRRAGRPQLHAGDRREIGQQPLVNGDAGGNQQHGGESGGDVEPARADEAGDSCTHTIQYTSGAVGVFRDNFSTTYR